MGISAESQIDDGRRSAGSSARRDDETQGRQEPVRVRNRRRVLRAARALVAEEGIEGLTMRRLALAAEVSVATVYNLIGSRDEVVEALSLDVLEQFDEALLELQSPDPLARAHELVNTVVDIVTAEVPRPLVLAALSDEVLTDELGNVWRSGHLLAAAVRSMIERGELEGSLSPDALAGQVWFSYTRFLRLWASGLLDDREFRARALYALDVCLMALATGAVRDRLVAHARPLEVQFSGSWAPSSSAAPVSTRP